MTSAARGSWPSGAIGVLALGGVVLALSLGVRQGFGLFLVPVSEDLSLGREVFAFAVAMQNLIWGAAQPFAGALAARFGPFRIAALGALLYAAGLAVMGSASGAFALYLGGGVLVGLGLAATSFAVIFQAVGDAVDPERQSFALGLASAAGSLGQFLFVVPVERLIGAYGWDNAAFFLAVLVALAASFAALSARGTGARLATGFENLRVALRAAARHGGYHLLTAAFFVCGFQVVFIAVHLPGYLAAQGLPPETAALALALIGLFNIFGTFGAGYLGARFRKKYVLSALYLLRAAAIAVFVLLPVTETSALVFAAAAGLLWLATVPLTSGLVAQIFGGAQLGVLFGIVFLGHQLGSFFGAWLGGFLFDRTGSYDAAWAVTVALGILAAVMHLPIRDANVAPARAAPV